MRRWRAGRAETAGSSRRIAQNPCISSTNTRKCNKYITLLHTIKTWKQKYWMQMYKMDFEWETHLLMFFLKCTFLKFYWTYWQKSNSRPKFISCFSWLIPFYLFLILDSRKAAQLINPRKQIQLEDFLSEDLRKQFEKNIENSVM